MTKYCEDILRRPVLISIYERLLLIFQGNVEKAGFQQWINVSGKGACGASGPAFSFLWLIRRVRRASVGGFWVLWSGLGGGWCRGDIAQGAMGIIYFGSLFSVGWIVVNHIWLFDAGGLGPWALGLAVVGSCGGRSGAFGGLCRLGCGGLVGSGGMALLSTALVRFFTFIVVLLVVVTFICYL